MKKLITILVLSLCLCFVSEAQDFGVKTNTLYWCTATPNVGIEYTIGNKWTMEIEAGYNPWELNKAENTKAKHLLVSPEFRYWFCEPYLGHFLAVGSNLTYFNIGALPVLDLKDSRVQGHAVSIGINYGYSWPIARKWNFECNVGLGLWYTNYDKYESRKCGLFQETVSKHFFAPTSLGASFVYIIK